MRIAIDKAWVQNDVKVKSPALSGVVVVVVIFFNLFFCGLSRFIESFLSLFLFFSFSRFFALHSYRRYRGSIKLRYRYW